MLERDRGEDGVHNEWAGSLSVLHKTAQDLPVPIARFENPGGWLAEPGSAFLVLFRPRMVGVEQQARMVRITGEENPPPAR